MLITLQPLFFQFTLGDGAVHSAIRMVCSFSPVPGHIIADAFQQASPGLHPDLHPHAQRRQLPCRRSTCCILPIRRYSLHCCWRGHVQRDQAGRQDRQHLRLSRSHRRWLWCVHATRLCHCCRLCASSPHSCCYRYHQHRSNRIRSHCSSKSYHSYSYNTLADIQ